MHRVLALNSRWLNRAPTRLDLAVFFSSSRTYIPSRSGDQVLPRCRAAPWTTTTTTTPPRRCLHMQADASTTLSAESNPPSILSAPATSLPRQCTGCGALSQTADPNQPGYFDLNRKAVKAYLGIEGPPRTSRSEDRIYETVLSQLDPNELEKKGVDVQALALGLPPTESRPRAPPKKPLCDRCHYLLHNHTGESIYHPSMDSIRDTLSESPYKYNHVYHVLDAADFPMSLVPKISQLLDTMPLRSRNRRSRIGRFYHGQKTDISFVIARADLLAPTKPQVDNLFPYLREVLRDALGHLGPGIRLGNLRAVSAKRSWWTKELKEDIWKRGGGGWMLGKANVGKSQLFEAVFPKGRMDWDPSKHQITVDMEARSEAEELGSPAKEAEDDVLDEYSLLPPRPKETQFPEMPLVSDLPGTTASPIRIPFGNGRGELIDLPGLERSGLESHVQKEHRLSLLMQSRIVPEQMTLKPGQSLLLGGFIRITPREPAPVLLTYAFTPIKPHVCRTDKAIGIQNQTGEVNVENIALPGTGDKTKLAGSFKLRWDVTRQRTGPLTRKSAVGLDVERLPYRVVAADILIEGVGWVEIAAQVRTRDLLKRRPPPQLELDEPEPEVDTELYSNLSAMERLEALSEDTTTSRKSRVAPPPPPPVEQGAGEPDWPVVDVYSPEGKYVSCRQPMNGWMLNKPRVTAASRRVRPKKSMKGVKKTEKKLRREREAAGATPASI
ncbi:hypothetical protein F5Y14DRAFT_426249 [Nemania sp. NC0429]|nr:hypothetical protein F5Y14DRAFT_426249 [Nemania sp. NC0429]